MRRYTQRKFSLNELTTLIHFVEHCGTCTRSSTYANAQFYFLIYYFDWLWIGFHCVLNAVQRKHIPTHTRYKIHTPFNVTSNKYVVYVVFIFYFWYCGDDGEKYAIQKSEYARTILILNTHRPHAPSQSLTYATLIKCMLSVYCPVGCLCILTSKCVTSWLCGWV